MLQEVNILNKHGEKTLSVEKSTCELQAFKEPLSRLVAPNIKTKKVLDEDSYIQVMWL
jgi:hypothetical protein